MDYVIGDVHGCYEQLMQLLEIIAYDPDKDCLWFTGDFMNRGPFSLEVLRFVSSLTIKPKIVLGNHDLHFLASFFLNKNVSKKNTIYYQLISAPDIHEIIDWLIHQKLAIYESDLNILLTHAGICPTWTVKQVIGYAREVESALQDPKTRINYFESLYGNKPDQWSEDLTDGTRLRVITNYLTRMRYLDKHSWALRLEYNALTDNPEVIPWFECIAKSSGLPTLLFGHWAALEAKTNRSDIIGLDTACYYGKWLSAYCLQTKRIVRVVGIDYQRLDIYRR